jgi:hypothetical protein
LAITLPSSLPVLLRSKVKFFTTKYSKEPCYFCVIQKRFALMWKCYRFKKLSLSIVIASAACVPVIALFRYRYRKIGSVIASLSYHFRNI